MRPVWSGSISFGLINIPVKLVSAVQAHELDLDMLSKKDLAPIKYARIDSETGEEVPWKNIVKGFQYAKGKYVVVTDEDFKKASPEKSKSIAISQFAKEHEIDSIFYEKPYYLIPAKGAEKSYQLLLESLRKADAVGIAEFVLRNREHICAIKPYNDILLLQQMRYEQEIKQAPEVSLPQSEHISDKELELGVKLIQQLSEPFDAAAYKDTYITSLKKIIKAKAAGKKIHIAEPKEETAPNVKDLMEVLRRSLDRSKKIA